MPFIAEGKTNCSSPTQARIHHDSGGVVVASYALTPHALLIDEAGPGEAGREENQKPKRPLPVKPYRNSGKSHLLQGALSDEAKSEATMAGSCGKRLLAITVLLGAATIPTTGLRVREEGASLLGTSGGLHRTSRHPSRQRESTARVEAKSGKISKAR